MPPRQRRDRPADIGRVLNHAMTISDVELLRSKWQSVQVGSHGQHIFPDQQFPWDRVHRFRNVRADQCAGHARQDFSVITRAAAALEHPFVAEVAGTPAGALEDRVANQRRPVVGIALKFMEPVPLPSKTLGVSASLDKSGNSIPDGKDPLAIGTSKFAFQDGVGVRRPTVQFERSGALGTDEQVEKMFPHLSILR